MIFPVPDAREMLHNQEHTLALLPWLAKLHIVRLEAFASDTQTCVDAAMPLRADSLTTAQPHLHQPQPCLSLAEATHRSQHDPQLECRR